MYVLSEDDNWGIFAVVQESERTNFLIGVAVIEEASCQSIDMDLIDNSVTNLDYGQSRTYPVTCYDDGSVFVVNITIKKVVTY